MLKLCHEMFRLSFRVNSNFRMFNAKIMSEYLKFSLVVEFVCAVEKCCVVLVRCEQ